MDQEKLDLFSLLLKNTYEETVHIDVVQVKREKMLVRLEILRKACKDKEYDKANYVLLDICDKVLNDPYSDEYNIKQVEVDMVVFSSAVMSISVRHYDRVKQIMTGLIMKYRNPIFYYLLGLSYFYDLSFKEAQQQFNVVMQLLSENRSTKFPWPDTDIMIIRIGADKIKEYTTVFINAITSIKDTKKIKSLTFTERIETIGISRTHHNSSLNLNVGIGNFIQYEIYPHIQAILGDLLKFDKSKLPIEYHKILSETHKANTKLPQETVSPQKKTDVNSEKKAEKKMESTVLLEVKPKKAAIFTEVAASDKIIIKKRQNQMVQVQPTTKCKQIQTVSKSTHQQTQTTEDITGISDKSKLALDQETIAGLKSKLQQMTSKLKEAEAKLSRNKDNTELNEKNRLIGEQQELICNLKLKLNQSNIKQRELETKLSKLNGKISELTKNNKIIEAESKKHKETISELRNYNQMLEKGAKNIGKKQEDLKLIQKNLFDKYRNVYFLQIQFYENFHRRCENVLGVLENISSYLTEITVPTKAECERSISEWFSAMVSCLDVLQVNKKLFNKYDKYISQESLVALSNISPMMPIQEPYDILLESVPILIYTIVDYEKMLQNNNKAKKEKSKEIKKDNIDSKNNFSGKTDYRKKCNFIHKEHSDLLNDAASSMYVKPSKIGTVSEGENSNHIKTIESNSKKFRSLLSYLKQNIPYRTEGDIVNALNLYRQNNNGSLSGMAVQFILYNVLKILETPETAWSAVKNDFDELDDSKELCPICIEEIRDEPKSVLTCRHVYHTECIREWLAVNRVCAVCRKYTVLDEDFPPLKN